MAGIKDVAKKAGVSVTTVSRVINNRGYISKETRTKVDQAMIELDYFPNQIARALQQNQSYVIGVLVPDSSHPFFAELVKIIETSAHQANYKILLCNSGGDANKEAKYISLLRENRVDGIVMCSHSLEIEEYQKVNLPIVSFDRIISNNIPYIGSDNFRGGEMATQHLIDKGCQQLLHISGTLDEGFLTNRRTDAFKLTCMKHEIPFHIVEGERNQMSFDYYMDFIEKEISQHLSSVDGVFCSSDLAAYALYTYAVNSDIKVPDDLKIIGYDYHAFTRILQDPKITTIAQPIQRMAKVICATIIRMIEDEDMEFINNTTMDVHLMEGTTT
ncbi:LacI family DNA-binding transcriptional regulator [Gracilibacillus phocaeensis]|uniref:LacI family DNA-binding transcriptional regulator n=1 Tax=Gracilibacillus phocaeensis TaxID=2042304 RepID=UPI00102F86F6|nr:LacI family DNA-binding transcriptional regulator [Gracilibacillus phocaeensis]